MLNSSYKYPIFQTFAREKKYAVLVDYAKSIIIQSIIMITNAYQSANGTEMTDSTINSWTSELKDGLCIHSF